MSRVFPKPFVATTLALEADEALITRFKELSPLGNHFRVDALVGEEVLLGHDEGVIGGTGLFETPVGLAGALGTVFAALGGRIAGAGGR